MCVCDRLDVEKNTEQSPTLDPDWSWSGDLNHKQTEAVSKCAWASSCDAYCLCLCQNAAYSVIKMFLNNDVSAPICCYSECSFLRTNQCSFTNTRTCRSPPHPQLKISTMVHNMLVLLMGPRDQDPQQDECICENSNAPKQTRQDVTPKTCL